MKTEELIEFAKASDISGDVLVKELIAALEEADTRTSSEVEADFQGRHNRENLGNVIGWVVVTKDEQGIAYNNVTTRERAEAFAAEYADSEFKVFPVVRTL